MAYVKPTEQQIKFAMEEGWDREEAKRGYTIVDFDGTGMLEIEAIADVYVRIGEDGDVYYLDDIEYGFDDDACAYEAARSGFCSIIPIDELPENFDRRYFGWVDTPENRKAIEDYCSDPDNYYCNGNSLI